MATIKLESVGDRSNGVGVGFLFVYVIELELNESSMFIDVHVYVWEKQLVFNLLQTRSYSKFIGGGGSLLYLSLFHRLSSPFSFILQNLIFIASKQRHEKVVTTCTLGYSYYDDHDDDHWRQYIYMLLNLE